MPINWFFNNCSSQFGTRMLDTKTEKMHCPYNRSMQLEKS